MTALRRPNLVLGPWPVALGTQPSAPSTQYSVLSTQYISVLLTRWLGTADLFPQRVPAAKLGHRTEAAGVQYGRHQRELGQSERRSRPNHGHQGRRDRRGSRRAVSLRPPTKRQGSVPVH